MQKLDEQKLLDLLSYIIESYAPWEHQQRVRCRELLSDLKYPKSVAAANVEEDTCKN